ncbi:nicotinate-nicotinamide nucleotide adenylyltransferase [Methylophaga sp. 41_12_T18]|nr:nicotinate-nicotinamide nucleotide adenylyltransferase [Methylophaga sp. 41_12_T18]
MTDSAIGILGGTFDPVHFGHLRPALDVADQLGLEQIHLIPCAVPPHRETPLATAQQRVALLLLAIKNNPRFVVDERELQREGPSYTIDTLRSLRQEFPAKPLYLLVGTDAFMGIQSWHEWQQLLELTHIVVMQRPDETTAMPDALASWYQQHLVTNDDVNLAGKIIPVKVTQLSISATQIRTSIANGASPQYLLPDAVISLVDMLGLYQQKE